MVVCRFFEQGTCRYGANCKFEHPGSNRQNSNPFSNNNSSGGFSKANQWSLNPETLVKDLTEERPQWILSAYGPGRDAPEQLWGGAVEQSFEEMRLHFETGAAAGNPQGALNDIQQLHTQVQEKLQTALSNPSGAIDYVLQASNNHPNRHDKCRTNTPLTGEFAVGKRPVGPGQPANAFSSAATTNSSPFGQPAQSSNPFNTGGTSAFGQTAPSSQPSAFGQPAALGQSPFGGASNGGGFGQASTLGQKPSPFGQPSALGSGGGGFGQPAALGSATGGGFGQAPALGQKPNPFGAAGGFGQPPQLGAAQPNPFGAAGGFGQAPQLGAAKPNPFSGGNAAPAPSPFTSMGGANSTASPFAQNNQPSTTSPFAQPPQQPPAPEVSMGSTSSFSNNTSASPFAQASQPAAPAFGQPSKPAGNPFAQASSASPFAAPAQQAATGAPSVGGGAGNGNSPYPPGSSQQHPPYPGVKGMDNRLQSWKGKPVTYKEIEGKPTPVVQNFNGTFNKIWFPDGPPAYYKDTEPDREYTDAEKAQWQQFMSTGKFDLAGAGGSGMPEAPPMREACTWDF